MDTNIFDSCDCDNCCDYGNCFDNDNLADNIGNTGNVNFNDFDQCNCSRNNCMNPIDRNLRELDEDLCDMRVLVAETKSNLISLAQTMCRCGYVNNTEKALLLNLERQLKEMNCKIKDSKGHVDKLNCLLD